MPVHSGVKALTFDLFGTILDLGGSLTPYIARFLTEKNASVTADQFWQQWRSDHVECGMRGAWVNRYGLPYEDTPYRSDVIVPNFTELALALT